jgi:hypothetical protein
MFLGGLFRRVIVFSVLLATAGVFFVASPVNAAINSEINLQGKLTNPDGTNVTDGNYSIRFRIYNHVSNDGAAACAANSCLWEETQGSVAVDDGIFRVALGSVTSLPGSVDFNTAPLFLGIKVSTDAEMTPRIKFTATPYAFNSDRLNGLASSAFGQLTAASQTWTGTNTFQPTTNISSMVVRQTSFGSPTANIFNLQTANSTNILQVTGPAANEAAVTLNSVGATRALTLDSASGTLVLGSNTTTLQKSGTALTVDVNSGSNSTVTITNAGAGIASLSVEGGVTVGANQDITTTAGTGTLTLNSTVTNASDSAIVINPSFTGGATDGLTYNALSVAAFTATNAAGVDNVNGLSVGNLTDPGATVSSRAITLGTGWDTLIGGSTAGTNLLSFTNYTVSSAGSVTIGAGQSYTGTGAVSLSSGGANALNLDTGGGAALNIGSTNATSIVVGGNAAATLTQRVATTSTTAYTLQGAGGADFMIVDSTNNRLQIGDTVADSTGVLLVLDTKNTAGDPTGVNGASYYNSNDGKARCFENSIWTDCNVTPILGETTLGVAAATITVNLSASSEFLHCRIDAKDRTVASGVNMRFNGDSGGANYNWNTYGIIAAAVIDSQDNSDSEIQLTGTATGAVAFSADVSITNFSDTVKAVDWTAMGADPVGTNLNRYSGGGMWSNTANSISSVSFLASAGNFTAGSHAWCEGRNIR